MLSTSLTPNIYLHSTFTSEELDAKEIRSHDVQTVRNGLGGEERTKEQNFSFGKLRDTLHNDEHNRICPEYTVGYNSVHSQ